MAHLRIDVAEGMTLAADELGPESGTPVILLHGGGQNRHAWKATATTLADAGYRVLSVDARGHGDSTWSPEGHYEMEDLAADLTVVLQRFDRPPAVVGASMGGMTALMAQGGSTEQLFSAVVLVDVTPRMEMAGVTRIMSFMTANPDGFASLDDAADTIAAYNPHRPRSASVEGLKRVLRQGDDGRWRWRWDPKFLTSKAEMMTGDPVDAEARMARMASTMYEAARRVAVPTLLVRGAESDLVSDQSVEEFLAAVPHASYVDVRGAGHMVAGDENDAFTTAVVDFLRTHLGATSAEAAKLAAREEAATAMRRLGHVFVGRDAPTSLLEEVTATVRRLADRLDSSPPRDRLAEYLASDRMRAPLEQGSHGGDTAAGGLVDLGRHSLIGGVANPFGVAAVYTREGDEVVARMTLGEAFEGRPGRAHGGVVSAAIQETMAALLSTTGTSALATSLELGYLGPTPLHAELEFRARLASRDGPRLVVQCDGHSGGHPFVHAEGRFVEVDLAQLVRELSGEDQGLRQ